MVGGVESDIPGRDANWPRLILYKDRSKDYSGCKEGSGSCKITPKGSITPSYEDGRSYSWYVPAEGDRRAFGAFVNVKYICGS